MSYLAIMLLAYIQNISFTMVSRARNRDSVAYHATCAVFSNGLWFATIGLLVEADLSWEVAPFYIVGTVLGSLTGANASIHIEKLIGAKT